MAKSDVELSGVASLPEENPSPVLRLALDGKISYSNPAGKAILQAWGCSVGGPAPQVWREIVKEVLTKDASRVIELEYGPVIYSFSVVPIPQLGCANLYVSDVTEREMVVRALRESEERFRSMFESSGVGIGIATPDGSLLEANPALLSLMGFTKEEARGVNFIELIHPDDLERVREARKKMVADGISSYQYEARIRHKSGKYLLTEVTGSAVEGELGRPLYTVAVVKDIAAEKEAKEALRESEEKYRELVEKATSIIIKIDLAGRMVSFNNYAEVFFGYNREVVLGKSFYGTIAPMTESASRDLTALITGLISYPKHYGTSISESVKKGGEHVWIQWNNSVVKDEHGRPTGVLCVGTDITERVLAENALAESEAKFRASFESAATGMSMTGTDDRFIRVNRALCAILGYSEDELQGKNVLEVTLPEDRPKSEELLRKLFEREVQELHYEKRYVHKDGHVVWGNVSSAAVRGPDGEVLYFFTQVEDITARKLAEKNLEMYRSHLEDMVNARARELEDAHAKLLKAERLAATGVLSTQLAHDLRNPLAGIMAEAYLLNELMSKSHDPRVKDTLRLLSESVGHAGKIMDDLLEFVNVRESMKESVDLEALVEELVASLHIPKGIRLVLRKAPAIHVAVDRAYVLRALANLVDNAIAAMPRGGTLTISFALESGLVTISIMDTGVGMGEARLAKIFSPFFTTKAKGLGLGLPIARKLLEAQGGTIDIVSKEGKGTTVAVTLPAAQDTPGSAKKPAPARRVTLKIGEKAR